MKFFIYISLLALGVSGDTCDSESDVASHLAIRSKIAGGSKTAAGVQFNEVAEFQIELLGPPDAGIEACVFFWSANPNDGEVKVVIPVSTVTDSNGLVVINNENNPFNPPGVPFMAAITDVCPVEGDVLDVTAFFTLNPASDTIGFTVPLPQVAGLLEAVRSVLDGLGMPGVDIVYSASAQLPDIIFRDSGLNEVYIVPFEGGNQIVRPDGTPVDPADFNPPTATLPTLGAINPAFDPSAIGDPHIHTMAGDHYTLLQEGSFLLWQFALEKPHVQWQLYAHYAGQQSFTKGLLLVDTSGPQPSTMEITSEKCQWQSQGETKDWSPITSENEELLSTSSSRMKLVNHEHKDVKEIKLFLAEEKAPVASLKVMCRQGRHIDLKLHMNKKKWGNFVSGELKGHEHQDSKVKKISALQLDAKDDQEFQVTKTWKELGGSSDAQQYLQNLDEHPHIALLQACDPQAEADARAICRKHLGEMASSSTYFNECVFDVCSGAGEDAAEMRAEMLKF